LIKSNKRLSENPDHFGRVFLLPLTKILFGLIIESSQQGANMSDRFTIAPYTFNEIGRNQRSIAVKVVGFWSQDPISIYVQRGWSEKVEWKFSLSVSSGGRDSKVVASDAEAYTNYGEAIVAAASVIRDMEANIDLIEAGYQEYRAELAAEQARLEAEKQVRIAADEPIGKIRAKAIVAQLAAESALNTHREVIREFKVRGDDEKRLFSAVTRDKTKFYYGYGSLIISRSDLIAKIADFSAQGVV
jgi:hypothetical protein